MDINKQFEVCPQFMKYVDDDDYKVVFTFLVNCDDNGRFKMPDVDELAFGINEPRKKVAKTMDRLTKLGVVKKDILSQDKDIHIIDLSWRRDEYLREQRNCPSW